jgi:hypothetical protein
LNKLQDYMLNKENIERGFLSRQSENVNKLKEKYNKNGSIKNTDTTINVDAIIKKDATTKDANNKTNKFFFPKEKDTLFWCFYIMKHGLLNYQMINNRNIVFEKTNKIEYIEKIRKEKHILKNYKFASISNIENNLVNDFKIDTFSFLTLCVIENINVIFIKRKTYYELQMNDSNTVYIIKQNENEKYGFEMIEKTNKNVYDNYKNNYYQIDNIDKPIKSITYYKVSDLIDICIKLCIEQTNTETGKQKPKKELYESIIQKL